SSIVGWNFTSPRSIPASSTHVHDKSCETSTFRLPGHAKAALMTLSNLVPAVRVHAIEAVGKGSRLHMDVLAERVRRLEPHRICIIKPSALGDVVHTIPILP